MGEITCKIEGCGRPVQVKKHGWCYTHYKRWQRHSDPITPSRYDKDAITRFFERVDVGDCWTWTASKSNGYGYFCPPGSRQAMGAHLWLYRELVGPVAPGHELDHLCRNRACVNPDHLEPVTKRENGLRGYSPAAINARKTRCPKGHEYTDANTKRGVRGARVCRTCWNAWRREHIASQKKESREQVSQ